MTPDNPPGDDPRSIRLAQVRAESGIKSLGQLCFLVGFLCVLLAIVLGLGATGVLPHDPALHEWLTPGQARLAFGILAATLLVVALGHWALGHGLFRLHAWARWMVVVLTGLSLISTIGFGVGLCFVYPLWGLLCLGIGGALHAMILHPLLTKGAGMVFSRPYKEVIRATPEIRSRMHWLLKLCLALILVGVIGIVAFLSAYYLRLID